MVAWLTPYDRTISACTSLAAILANASRFWKSDGGLNLIEELAKKGVQ
jgi:hypothetical protein